MLRKDRLSPGLLLLDEPAEGGWASDRRSGRDLRCFSGGGNIFGLAKERDHARDEKGLELALAMLNSRPC
jgi:hypothetical protein